MAPAIAVPRLLDRVGLRLDDIDLIEIHEAFVAQVLANAAAWQQGWKGPPTDPVKWDRVNVNGSSIAVGHPWSEPAGEFSPPWPTRWRDAHAVWTHQHVCGRGDVRGFSSDPGSNQKLNEGRLDHACCECGREICSTSRPSRMIAGSWATSRMCRCIFWGRTTTLGDPWRRKVRYRGFFPAAS